jgi:hypothetical protein
LQVGEITARVLEQRALVDHRQLQVRVGVVDRLPARLRDCHERECDRAERQRRARPGVCPSRSRNDTAQVGRTRKKRGDREREHECRLDEHRQGEIAARPHQREAIACVPRREHDGEPRESKEPDEQERVVADPQLGATDAGGTTSTAAVTAAATTDGAKR